MKPVSPADMIHSLGDAGITQQAIAIRLQISDSSVSRYASLEREPSYSIGKGIERMYETNVPGTKQRR